MHIVRGLDTYRTSIWYEERGVEQFAILNLMQLWSADAADTKGSFNLAASAP